MNTSNTTLDKKTKSLVSIGAAAAVNCRPCLEHHIPLGNNAGLSQDEIRQAIKLGFAVNRGAHAKTQKYIDEVIANSEGQATPTECCDEDTAKRTGCC